MSSTDRYVYTATFDDGSQVMVEEYIDSNGERVTFQAAKRGATREVWGPPRRLGEAP